MKQADIAIIGAGIVGLAIAYAAAKQGKSVVVFERTPKALGASIRNFGLLWPIGQPQGKMYKRAIRSRQVWEELAAEAGIWKRNNGSLHLAYQKDEMNVLEEYYQKNSPLCEILTKEKVLDKSRAVKSSGLLGGLFSRTEATVDPREALHKIPLYLEEKFKVQFRYEKVVTDINYPTIKAGDEVWQSEKIFVCSGPDFETLYPAEFKATGITRCKLQMMRTAPFPENFIGPTLCGGLTLTHYASFKQCNSLEILKKRFMEQNPEFEKWGIHVMITQNARGELVIGDSHEYGLALEPFDKEEINQIILRYLQTFTTIPDLAITERWHGIYPKLEGKTEMILKPEKGVTIVNGLSGAGMTLSFGLAEEVLGQE
jgi:D-hydroxyproline dehydrogenase subunit beta